MNLHKFSDNFLVKRSFSLTITAAAVAGSGVDCKGYMKAMAIFDSAPSGAGTTSDCKLQEDSDVAFGTVADVSGGAFAQATTTGGSKIQVMDIDLGKRLRYLRLHHTGAGGSAAGAASGMFVLWGKRLAPAQDETVVSV